MGMTSMHETFTIHKGTGSLPIKRKEENTFTEKFSSRKLLFSIRVLIRMNINLIRIRIV